jgi:hypothetical protein
LKKSKNALRELPAPQAARRLEGYQGGSYEKRCEAAYNFKLTNEITGFFDLTSFPSSVPTYAPDNVDIDFN